MPGASTDKDIVTVRRVLPHEHVPDDPPFVDGIPFRSHDIGSESLRKLFSYLELSAGNKVVDLDEFLGALKVTDEQFLPGQIYIRDCMKKIFGYFRQDVLKRDSNRVLLGSPGVGKSVLFFITALYKAETIRPPIAYIRKTREEKLVSVFVMFRTANGVRVFWSRDVRKKKFKTIADLRDAIMEGFKRDFVVFLDGPRHDEEQDLNAFYEYFCTSGGHPLPKNAQKDLFLWILDGWTENEAIDLGKSQHQEKLFIEAYSKFGGCIRDISLYVNSNDRSRRLSEATLKGLCRRVANKNIDLVLTTMTRNNDDDSGNPDRLRTMFNGQSISDDIPDPIQIVDSQLAIRMLRERQTLGSYLRALYEARLIKSGTVVGVYFEEVLHQWFMQSLPGDIEEIIIATGTWADSVRKLIRKGAYWIPETPNFPNIDAAVVIGRVLVTFQYTKTSDHGFNRDTFWQDFVCVVRQKLDFDSVHVYIVLIDKVSSKLQVEFTRQWKVSSGTRITSALVSIPCTSSYVNIDTTSEQTVQQTAAAGFSRLTYGSET